MSRETTLPPADTERTFSDISGDENLLRPGVDSLCRSLGIDSSGLQRYPTGSVPVYSVGGLVLKLFPPVHVSEYLVEAGVLAAVEGRLPVPTPRVHEVGERHGWGYVVMDRLAGTGLHELWPTASREEKVRLAGQMGEILGALHALPAPGIDPWWPADWDAFVDEQRSSAVERHRALGLSETWLEQVPDFLADVHLGHRAPVLLHTEVMPTNLLAICDGAGNLSLSGLFDFEAAMRGAPQYDFVALGVFAAQGDIGVLHQALTAYGYRDEELDHDLSRQVLAWTILHYYGNLASYLRRLPRPTEPTLDALASCWFGEPDVGHERRPWALTPPAPSAIVAPMSSTPPTDPTAALNQVLSEVIDVVLDVKQAHRKVPETHALHAELDQLFGDLATWAELLMERDQALDVSPLSSMPSVAGRQPPNRWSGAASDEEVREVIGEHLDRLQHHTAAARAEQEDERSRAALAEVERGLLAHRQALGET